jgi:hypothetical protein
VGEVVRDGEFECLLDEAEVSNGPGPTEAQDEEERRERILLAVGQGIKGFSPARSGTLIFDKARDDSTGAARASGRRHRGGWSAAGPQR